jgi:hypothetical protein
VRAFGEEEQKEEEAASERPPPVCVIAPARISLEPGADHMTAKTGINFRQTLTFSLISLHKRNL